MLREHLMPLHVPCFHWLFLSVILARRYNNSEGIQQQHRTHGHYARWVCRRSLCTLCSDGIVLQVRTVLIETWFYVMLP